MRVKSSGDLIASLNDVNESQEAEVKRLQLELDELVATLECYRAKASQAAAVASTALEAANAEAFRAVQARTAAETAFHGAEARIVESLALVEVLREKVEEAEAEKATATTVAASSTTTSTGTCTDTDTISTSTHSVASTQTDPMPVEFEDYSVFGASRNAYKSLLRLIELSQAQKVDYTPSFHGHWNGGVLRPPTLSNGTQHRLNGHPGGR